MTAHVVESPAEEISLPLAAAALGITHRRAYDLLLRGPLQAIRRGARWYVTRASVRDAAKYLQHRRRTARERAAPQPAARVS